MRYHLLTCDVFTDRLFGGNPLAVLPEAAGIDGERMQVIAREMNLSETSFVLPPRDSSELAFVRIFTPAREMPFAGHPTIGTALTLARLGRVPNAPRDGDARIVLGELAGPVPVRVRYVAGQPVEAELTAPALPSLGEPVDSAALAVAVGLTLDDLVQGGSGPRVASCGAPFLEVELRSRAALARARIADPSALPTGSVGVHLFTRDVAEPGIDLAVRMFAPSHGVSEDPATGSAACALAGLLALSDPARDGELRWSMLQGVEMGRPSILMTTAVKQGGRVTAIRVAGSDVPVIDGWIEV